MYNLFSFYLRATNFFSLQTNLQESKTYLLELQITRCLDKRYKSKDGKYPVCLRIYYNRKYSYINTAVSLTSNEYDNLQAKKVFPDLKDALRKILDIEAIVNSYLVECKAYDIKAIRAFIKLEAQNKEKQEKKNSLNVLDWFQVKIDLCISSKQFGSAESYVSSKNVYNQLLNQKYLTFDYFTPERLKEIETRMVDERGVAISTVGKHARNLRSIFRLAMSHGVIPSTSYPFGRYKYSIPEVVQAKKSLSRTMLADLAAYSPNGFYEKRAISYFFFSYYGNGMNLKDIAYLRFKDLKGSILYYHRNKTRNTKSQLKSIKVFVIDEMKEIISSIGARNLLPDAFVFPILTSAIKGSNIDTKIHTLNKSINKTLKIISDKLKFERPITLGMARHSFANALKQEGVNINSIQEFLGHTSSATTEHYLSSLEDETLSTHSQKLNDYFKKK